MPQCRHQHPNCKHCPKKQECKCRQTKIAKCSCVPDVVKIRYLKPPISKCKDAGVVKKKIEHATKWNSLLIPVQHRQDLQLSSDDPLEFLPVDARRPSQPEQALHVRTDVLLDGQFGLAVPLRLAF